MRLKLACALLALILAPIATPADAKIYRNAEFGFRALVPPGYPACYPGPDEHDHGFDFVPDRKAKPNCGVSTGRFISASGFYNVIDDSATLKGDLAFYCGDKHLKCSEAPAGLKIRGWRSLSGQVRQPDGVIDVHVVVHAGTWPTNPEPQGISYDFELQTTPVHYQTDLAMFRAFLKTVRIWRPKD